MGHKKIYKHSTHLKWNIERDSIVFMFGILFADGQINCYRGINLSTSYNNVVSIMSVGLLTVYEV